jgi:predicted DNA-binding transcriptional regulator YafY
MKRFTLGRLFRIYEKIKEGSFPDVPKLMEEEGVSERTIKRDIQMLKYSLNAPISYSKSRKGYYFTKNWEFPFPELSAGEVLTLFIANNLLKELKNTPLYEISFTLSKKLEKLLPDHISIKDKELEMLLSLPIKTPKININFIDKFDKLFDSIKQRKRIWIKYNNISNENILESDFDPYHLFNYDSVWYLVGFCYKTKEITDFSLDEIEEVKILKDRFNILNDFDIKDYIDKQFKSTSK